MRFSLGVSHADGVLRWHRAHSTLRAGYRCGWNERIGRELSAADVAPKNTIHTVWFVVRRLNEIVQMRQRRRMLMLGFPESMPWWFQNMQGSERIAPIGITVPETRTRSLVCVCMHAYALQTLSLVRVKTPTWSRDREHQCIRSRRRVSMDSLSARAAGACTLPGRQFQVLVPIPSYWLLIV